MTVYRPVRFTELTLPASRTQKEATYQGIKGENQVGIRSGLRLEKGSDGGKTVRGQKPQAEVCLRRHHLIKSVEASKAVWQCD